MPSPDPRAAVRVAQFDRSLAAFNDEMGWKVGQAISTAVATYHAEVVEPLEKRLAALERTWWRKALAALAAWWAEMRKPTFGR